MKISIGSPNLRETVLTILKTCNLSTEYVDKIPKPADIVYKSQTIKVDTNKMDFSKMTEEDPIFGQFVVLQKIKEAKDSFKLKKWLSKHQEKAKDLTEKSKPLSDEMNRLQEAIRNEWNLLDIRWNCGWNETHYRGCLHSFMALAGQHPEAMHQLKG